MTETADQAEMVHHPVFARFYARLVDSLQERGQRQHRQELLGGLAGRVVEVGAGTGTNFAHYPAKVTEVVAVEPEGHLRHLAEAEAAGALVPVRVVDGVAGRLPLDDASCDAAVASLVLCSVADPTRALAEMRRVLREGGELRFYEHVVSEKSWGAPLQRVIDRLGYPSLCGGCHMSRDTVGAIEQAGFRIETSRRFRFAGLPHVLGFARRM